MLNIKHGSEGITGYPRANKSYETP